jgi:3-dehydroquinate synthase
MDHRFDFVRRSTTRVVVAAGAQERLPALLAEIGAPDVAIVHDESLAGPASVLAHRLPGARLCAVPAGEACKTLAHAERIARWLRSQGASRRTALVGFGGGSTTDLAGFVAAVYLRGVPYVACPTTTLALCDAALGGKNGVDLDGRKNELGVVRQPDLVLGDVDWLRTLPDALWREGFVETLKMAAVLDAAAFARLEALLPALAARDATAAAEAIALSVRLKMNVVVADETERDRRRWLNFGHTIGHALEAHALGALRHGECIALGMLAECRAAGAAVPADVTARLQQALQQLGAHAHWPAQFADVDALWSLCQLDKKASAGSVPTIVPTTLGGGAPVELTRQRLAHALA